MRLSTDPVCDDARATRVIHAALDRGITLLDTADVYCLDEADLGHNERLVAAALRSWGGDRSRVEIATKGGLTRPGGRWVPDGKAKHIRAACEASRLALGVDAIDLYYLHVVDPRTPLTTSVRALSALQHEGKIREVGLCNVTVSQIEAARRLVEIAAVQVSLSALDEDNFRNGVAEYCRDNGIRLVAYRPLGGERRAALDRDAVLRSVAAALDATPLELALAWLIDLNRCVEPVVGATRVESVRSIERAVALRLSEDDRERLDGRFPAGRLLRVPMRFRRPTKPEDGEVVLIMGMPGAGKSTTAREFVERGYDRLNRDSLVGTRRRLANLLQPLEAGLTAGKCRWVLDNTYPTRQSRNAVIECAWRHGIQARCVWRTTSLEDAQINAVTRLIRTVGKLPPVEEIRRRSKHDPTAFGPDAQFRYERDLEPPRLDEGFASIDEVPFNRAPMNDAYGRAILLEYDGVLCENASGDAPVMDPADVVLSDRCRTVLTQYHRDGWTLLASAWRPQVAHDPTVVHAIEACFERTRVLLGVDIDLAYCPHPPGPPVCWCRKPLPGLPIQFFIKHGIEPSRSIMVGRSAADRTLARRLSMQYRDGPEFFDRAVS